MKDKIVFETFRELGPYEVMNMVLDSPSCVNGEVRVKKYKVTIEEIEEPDSVIAERVKKLWDENENHHHYTPLKLMAKTVGLIL